MISHHRSTRPVAPRGAGNSVRWYLSPALVALVLTLMPLEGAYALSDPKGAAFGTAPGSIDGIPANRAVAPAALVEALAALHKKVPAYSRQTGMACSACHYQFPQLTPFGRLFKLNGYTLTGLQTIGQPGDSAGQESLKLAPVPALSTMVVASITQTSADQPGTQNGSAQFPQQLSFFLSGAI